MPSGLANYFAVGQQLDRKSVGMGGSGRRGQVGSPIDCGCSSLFVGRSLRSGRDEDAGQRANETSDGTQIWINPATRVAINPPRRLAKNRNGALSAVSTNLFY